MKIALVGATGNVGQRIMGELLRRGHTVTAIVRHPEKVEPAAGVTAARGDVLDGAALAEVLAGHDAVVHSVRFVDSSEEKVVAAVKAASGPRLLVVGGAGSLEVAPGVALIDSPGFPPEYKAESEAGRQFLNALRTETELDWTYISPSAFFAPGERTGKFRIGGDSLLTGEDGQSRISMEDYAIALVDELETPKHRRARFAVGY